MSGFGSYTGQTESGLKRTMYLKEGSNIVRVLPPFKSLAERGKIAQYWKLVWIPGTEKIYPVAIEERREKGRLVQTDPIVDAINARKEQYSSLIEELNSGSVPNLSGIDPAVRSEIKTYIEKNSVSSSEAVRALFKKYSENMRPQGQYYLNVMKLEGDVQVMAVGYDVWQLFLAKDREMKEHGVDCINVGPGKGRYFDFKKSLRVDPTSQRKWNYTVDIYSNNYVNDRGERVSKDVVAELSEAEISKIENEARDLGTLFKTLTADERALVMTLDPVNIDRVFARPETKSDHDDNEPVHQSEETVTAAGDNKDHLSKAFDELF